MTKDNIPPLESRLEEHVLPSGWYAEQDHIALSIAISLKRIADRMDDIASGTATLNCDARQS